MLELRASSIADTHAVAAAVASLSRSGDIIILAGEMGSGKTAFAQGVARAMGVEEPVTSPTFTLVHSYDLPEPVHGARMLHHADLYRLDRTSELADLALFELAEFGGIVLIEWGDIVESMFGDHLVVRLQSDDAAEGNVVVPDGARLISINGVGPGWAERWELLASKVGDFTC
jgi:tRNA threonylcarbamoyladenosine biosynthesis protein TsaE